MSKLEDLWDDLERQTTPKSKDNIIRAPFGYPGGKTKSAQKIIDYLPYRNSYVEPFGGSAAILLARHPSPLEVYNDRYGGVVAFYKCIRDASLMSKLCDRLDLTLHSREEFVIAKETWQDANDPVERAARWYQMMMHSFGALGRNWGRVTKGRATQGSKISKRLEAFPKVHERFRRVQVENQDWRDCLHDYDRNDAVFYLDPPYLDSAPGIYKSGMILKDHEELLDRVFSMKAFVAVSGYPNPLYDDRYWDDRLTWKKYVSIQSLGGTEGNKKSDLKDLEQRGYSDEVLWIKESL